MDLQPGVQLTGHKVDTVFIGSCTNGRISDLRQAAALLKGHKIAPGIRVMVVPGSQQVKAQAEAEGIADVFREAGADWREAGCSMCIAMNGDQGDPGEYILSTSNRNFEGRQGKGARTFLASPLTAAATALDRRRHRPAPAGRGQPCSCRREVDMAEPFTSFSSALIPLPAENVDTDQIIPARFLKTTEKSGLADALFYDWRYDADGQPRPDFVINQPEMQGRQVLLAGANFGSGSSREHAPWALTSWGIRAILSTSFADIFRNNSLKNGLLPIVVDEDTHRQLFDQFAASPEAEVTVDLEAQLVHLPGDQDLAFEVDPFARQMLLEGKDEIGWVLDRSAQIDAWEAANPARVDTRPSSAL